MTIHKSTPLEEYDQMVYDLAELRDDAPSDTERNAVIALFHVLTVHRPQPGKPKYAEDPRQCCGSWWRECPSVKAIKAFLDKEFSDE